MDAMEQVLADADLLRVILGLLPPESAESVVRVELVCKAWAAAVERDDYWRRALARRFPSALADVADAARAGGAAVARAGGAAAAHAAARKAFGRRLAAAERKLPSTYHLPPADNAVYELRQNYRFCLELREGDDNAHGAVLLSASFHVAWQRASAIRMVSSCRPAQNLQMHTLRGLDAPRLAAAAAENEANGLRASLVVERRAVAWDDAAAIETAQMLRDARVAVCVHEEDGYAVLGVQVQCCCTDAAHYGWIDGHMETCWVRRPAAADDGEAEDDDDDDFDDDFDDESKWLIVNPSLYVLLPLPPPPGRRSKVREPQVWLGFINTAGGVTDANDDEMLMLVKALEYA